MPTNYTPAPPPPPNMSYDSGYADPPPPHGPPEPTGYYGPLPPADPPPPPMPNQASGGYGGAPPGYHSGGHGGAPPASYSGGQGAPPTPPPPPTAAPVVAPTAAPQYAPITAPMLSPAGQAELAKAKAQQAPPVAGAGRAPAGPDMSLLPEHLRPQYGGLYYPNMATYEADVAAWVNGAKDDAEKKLRAGVAAQAVKGLKKMLASPYGLQLQINANQHDLLQDKSRLAQQVGEAERKANYVAGAYETAGAAAERDRQEAWQKRQAEHRADMERRIGEIDQLNNEIANTKLDPGRWWKNRGAGRSILALIGLGLGAFAEGYSGGKLKNRAAEMIERAIDRDIDAQKSDMWNKRAALKGKQTLYGMARQRFGDDRQAEMFARSQMWRQVAHTQRRVARGLADDRKKAQLELMATTADANANHFDLTMRQRAAQLHQQAIEAQRRAAAAAAAARAKKQYGLEAATKDEEQRYIPGVGLAKRGLGRKLLQKIALDEADYQSQMERLQRLHAHYKKGLAGKLSPTERTKADMDYARFVLQLTLKMSGKAATDAERKIVGRVSGLKDKPNRILEFPKLQEKAINFLMRTTDRERKAVRKKYGIRPIYAEHDPRKLIKMGLDPRMLHLDYSRTIPYTTYTAIK